MHFFRLQIDTACLDSGKNLDVLRGVKLLWVKGEPFLGRIASQIVFRKIWSVVWRVGIWIDDGNWATIRLTPQHLGARIARRACADDHDRLRSRDWLFFE